MMMATAMVRARTSARWASKRRTSANSSPATRLRSALTASWGRTRRRIAAARTADNDRRAPPSRSKAQHGVQPADRLGAAGGEVVVAVGQQPQHGPVVVGAHGNEALVAPGHDAAGLLKVPGAARRRGHPSTALAKVALRLAIQPVVPEQTALPAA
jgi:hypothetical protein